MAVGPRYIADTSALARLSHVEELAQQGRHRSVGLPDLLISAVAERAGLTILHYDADYDSVAGVTGQPTQWVVPRGSVP